MENFYVAEQTLLESIPILKKHGEVYRSQAIRGKTTPPTHCYIAVRKIMDGGNVINDVMAMYPVWDKIHDCWIYGVFKDGKGLSKEQKKQLKDWTRL